MLKWVCKKDGKTEEGKGLDYPKGKIWIYGTDLAYDEIKKLEKDFDVINLKKFKSEKIPTIYSKKPLCFNFVDYFLEGKEIKRINILFMINDNCLITIFEKPLPNYESFFSEYKDNFKRKDFNLYEIFFEIFDEDVNNNYDVLEAVENKITEIQSSLMKSEKISRELNQIIYLKRILIDLSKVFWHSVEIIFIMKKELAQQPAKVSAEKKELLDDIYNAYSHQLDSIATQKQLLAESISIAQTNISNKTNQTIRQLTFIMLILTGVSFIIAIPNTIATFFGIPYFGFSGDHTSSILVAILISTLVPIFWFYVYWKKIVKEVS